MVIDLHDHDTPALDAFDRDIARLKDGCKLLEEIWMAMIRSNSGGTDLFPNARAPGRNASMEAREDHLAANSLIVKMQDHFDLDDSE